MIILTGIAVGLVFGAVFAILYDPEYASSVSLMVKVDSEYANQNQIAEVNDSLVHTYEAAFKYNREFCQRLNELAGTGEVLGYTADDVASMMHCEQVLPNTPTIKVTFLCPSPRAAFNLATALQILANTELEERFSNTLGAVDIFNEPQESADPVVGNPFLKMFAVGFLLSAVLLFGFYLIAALTDKVIHGESSLESFSDYPILGAVPILSGKRDSRIEDGEDGRDLD